jgi:phospholipase C
MTDEFFSRAQAAWASGRRKDAMFNLGIALHTVQDAVVPSHTHPEVLSSRLKVRDPSGNVVPGRDAFPAWAEARKGSYPVGSGGLYALPPSVNGVRIANSPGGWTYWMAAASYPYFPWSARWSAIVRSAVRCDASDFPENCRNASIRLLYRAQRVGAGFIRYFLAAVGDPAASQG